MATTLDVQIKTAIETAQSAKNIQQLRKSIKELNSLGLQLGSDQRKAFEQIATAVGEAQDKVEDLRDDFVAFKGSAVEKLTGSFNLLKEGVANLDFDKVSAQVKNLGSVIAANPLLFLAKIIIELVSNLEELEKAGGLVGDVFKFVGDVIDEAIDLFKDLTDSIGLTAFAAEEAAERIKIANEKTAQSIQRRYDAEIEYAKAAGKETTDLEIQKQKAILESNKIAILAIERRRAAEGELTEDEQKELDELIKSTEDAYKQINILNIQRTTNAKKATTERKKDAEKELTIYEKLLKQQRELDTAITNAIAEGDIEEAEKLGQSYIGVSNAITKINKEAEAAKKNVDALTEAFNLAVEENEETNLNKKEYIEGLGWLSPAAAQAARDKIKAERELAELERQIALGAASDLAKASQQLLNEETQREISESQKRLTALEADNNKQIALLEKRRDAGLVTESQVAQERAKIANKEAADKLKLEKKQAELQRKAFERNKKFQLGLVAIDLAKQISAINANAAANPANAFTGGIAGLTQSGFLTAAAIIQSGIQAGTILAQKPPAFARGGIVTGAGTGTSDSITARLSNGESVINANSTQAFAPLLSAINELGGGRSFLPERNNATAGAVAQPSQPIIKTYVVESEITNSQKNANKVKRLSSI